MISVQPVTQSQKASSQWSRRGSRDWLREKSCGGGRKVANTLLAGYKVNASVGEKRVQRSIVGIKRRATRRLCLADQ